MINRALAWFAPLQWAKRAQAIKRPVLLLAGALGCLGVSLVHAPTANARTRHERSWLVVRVRHNGLGSALMMVEGSGLSMDRLKAFGSPCVLVLRP